MKLLNDKAITHIYSNNEEDLEKTTHLCISAHQDDVEIMAYSQIYNCYKDKNKYFTAVNTTNGSGSPRTGKYKDLTDDDMIKLRIDEQIKAGEIGKYNAVIMMMYPSKDIKNKLNREPIEDLKNIILTTRPEYILTHNIFDKHSTHIATCLKVIEALKELKDIYRPKQIIGLEVWRGLDWLSSKDKILFDTSNNKRLEKDLIDVFASQVEGGKRYDLATMGRRYANATFFESHDTDQNKSLSYGIDMTQLVYSNISYQDFINEKIENFKNEISSQIDILTK